MDTLERIFARMKELKLEQKEFAMQIGVTPQAVSQWKNGKSKSYTKYIPQIAKALLTTSEYLLTGVTYPYTPPEDAEKDGPSTTDGAGPVRDGMDLDSKDTGELQQIIKTAFALMPKGEKLTLIQEMLQIAAAELRSPDKQDQK